MRVQNLKHLEDNALADLISKDYKPAFDELYRRYWERLFFYLVKVIRDQEEAEDILQEVFVSLWERRQQLFEVESLAGYLFTAVRFQGLKYIRKENKKGLFLSSLLQFFNHQSYSPEEKLHAKELELVIGKTIENLPSKMQQVFILSRKEELSHKEIADALNISDKTVKKQIGNALKIFRLNLEKENLISLILLILNFLCR